MFAICSAPRHVILQEVKSTILIHAEYFTLWQIAESINKYKSAANNVIMSEMDIFIDFRLTL